MFGGPTILQFDRFRFDPANRRLDDTSRAMRLNPKAFDVLRVLIEHRGQLVSKDQLLDEVWPDTHVADGVLKVCMAEIRGALGDLATEPRFIETVYGRGYRFIASVSAAEPAESGSLRDEPGRLPSGSLVAWPAGGAPTAHAPVGLVGRRREIEVLEEWLARALSGERQVVFVTGEPGVGKTALVEDFVAGAARRETVAITGGQCLEQLGSAEAYMPVVEAVGRLLREDRAARSLLRRYAPTWFAELPWLIEEEDRERLGREVLGAARERMLREMAEFVEALGAEIPLVLVLEDLHWSDPSTVDLVSLLATRRDAARFLLIATYRPVDLILARHPLRSVAQKLAASHRSSELTLDSLGVGGVVEYLERRFTGSRFPAEATRLLHERSDGNPLFLVTLVDHLLARGMIVERGGRWRAADALREELAGVPESLRPLIEQQLERLSAADRELLEAASLAGIEFSAAAPAAGVGRDPAEAEERFESLAGAGPFLRRAGSAEWPDGTVAASFAFRHSLYRETLAATIRPRRRADVHLRIGTALESAYGERSPELAGELALHFEEGGDRARAARFRRLAAESAARRYAFAEAESHLERAVSLLGELPATAERDRDEFALQSMVGTVRQATRGYAAPEVKEAFARALELSSEAAQESSAFPALCGIWTFYAVSGDVERALDLAERNRFIAEASGDRLMRLIAHQGLWTTHFFRGEFAAALRHLDEGEPLYDAEADRGSALVYGTDPKTAALSYRSLVLWTLGRVDAAVELSRRAVEEARALGHPLSLGRAMVFAAWLRRCRREADACGEEAEAILAYCREQGLPFWMPHGFGFRGWALTERGELERGIADVEKGLELWTAIGASLGRSPHEADLAALYARVGRVVDARALLERSRALVEGGERWHEPEIHRLDAELVLAEAGGADAAPAEARNRAERLVHEAVECARRQGARMLEFRAATMLARLCKRGARGKEARGRLANLLASFTEGFDTADLRDARQLLQR